MRLLIYQGYLKYPLFLILAILLPFILGNPYLIDLLTTTFIFAILALSLDIIMGYMGEFSFGHQAFFGIGAYASGLVCVRLGVPVWLGFLVAIVCATAAGFFVGYVALRAGRGFTIGMITLGFAMVMWRVVAGWAELTEGMKGLIGIPSPSIVIPGVFRIEFNSPLSHYFLALAFLIFIIYIISRLLNSRFGRALIAIRENEELGMGAGINSFKYYTIAFTLASAIAGLAGALYAHHVGFASPTLLSMYFIFITLIMVLVGGSGTLLGPLFGAAIFVWVPEFLRVNEELRLVFFGIILVLCIILMPKGIYPYLAGLWNRLVGLLVTRLNKMPWSVGR